MMQKLEFDAAELSLSMYASSLFLRERNFIAVPIFLSRFFPLSTIYVNTQSSINNPDQLRGKKVGIHSYQFTAGVWIRGILEERYGVPANSVSYFIGGLSDPKEIHVQLPFEPPQGIKLQALSNGETISDALDHGEIDAIYSPIPPPCFKKNTANIKRMFTNYSEAEERYFKESGIFPIMHVLVLNRGVYKDNPWIAKSLYDAFLKSKQTAYEEMYQRQTLDPWEAAHAEKLVKLMGADFWPYGLEPNENALTKFLQYHRKQGLSKYELKPREMFAPETISETS